MTKRAHTTLGGGREGRSASSLLSDPMRAAGLTFCFCSYNLGLFSTKIRKLRPNAYHVHRRSLPRPWTNAAATPTARDAGPLLSGDLR